MKTRTDEPLRESAGLKRYLNSFETLALAIGCSIGWGAFILPGSTFLPFSGYLGTVIGILLGAVTMFIISLNYHVMMNAYPDSGGTFTYAEKLFGHDHGFLAAWFLTLTYIAMLWANCTVLAMVAKNLFGNTFQIGFHFNIFGNRIYLGEMLLCVVSVVVLSCTCLFSKRLAAKLQVGLVLLLIAGIAVCFVLALEHISSDNTSPPFVSDNTRLSQIMHIFTLMPGVFMGFESISHSVSEFKFSVKRSHHIMSGSIVVVAILYILLTLIAAVGQPGDENSGIIFSSLESAIGTTGTTLLGFAMLAAIFTSIIGNTISLSRLLYTVSKRSGLLKGFSKLNKDGVPKNAVIFVATISVIVAFFSSMTISWVVDVAMIGAAFIYCYTSAAAYKLSKKAGNKLRQLCGALGILIAVVFTLLLLLPNTTLDSGFAKESYLILAVWSVIGFLVFRHVFKTDHKNRFGKTLTVWIALLTLISFTSIMWMYNATNASTEKAIDSISTFYIDEIKEQGFVQSAEHEQAEDRFIQKQTDKIDRSLVVGICVQSGLLLLSLAIMLNVYSLMQKRQNEIDARRIRAEENSRAKTFFLSNMSHDLRTPMNAIIGFTELAQRQGVSKEELHDYLNKIGVSGKQLLALINDVLEMSRIENGKIELEPVKVDLHKLVSELQDVFCEQMKSKKIEFTVDSSQVTDSRVICDRNRLSRVLMNLLSNAYKFTPEGGKVTMALKQTATASESASYELTVSDTGIGISPEFAEKVFVAFERERSSTISGIQGTGLGLAITKSIVEVMNGSISFETAENKGTTFKVEIDLPLDLTDDQDTAGEQIAQLDFTKYRLLLVEDIEVNREIAKRLLTAAGFTIETAENGKIAVETVEKADAGYFDAVLMDIQMPVMNGHDAAKAIRALGDKDKASVPIIAMTANAFSEDIQNEKLSGMNAHISKPLDIQNVLQTIGEVLMSVSADKQDG